MPKNRGSVVGVLPGLITPIQQSIEKILTAIKQTKYSGDPKLLF